MPKELEQIRLSITETHDHENIANENKWQNQMYNILNPKVESNWNNQFLNDFKNWWSFKSKRNNEQFILLFFWMKN